MGTLRSHRTGRLSHLIRTEAASGEVAAEFSEPELARSVEIRAGRRRLTQNGKNVSLASAFVEGFRVVILAPEHTEIIGGGAEERRRFLDRLQFSLDPAFLDLSQRYHRALHQKQALLKARLPYGVFADQVGPWNFELARDAEEIRNARRTLTAKLLPRVERHMAALAEEAGGVQLVYREPAVPMARELEERGVAEHASGRALCGPHRDDLTIRLRGEEAERLASQGERASILLGLKLSEVALIQEETGDPPMLLLDDLGATLDAIRRTRLLAHLAEGAYQGLVTTADAGILRAATDAGARAFRKKTEVSSGGFSIAHWLPA